MFVVRHVGHGGRQVRSLSAGETKRLSVAAHLLQNPEVLILDGKRRRYFAHSGRTPFAWVDRVVSPTREG